MALREKKDRWYNVIVEKELRRKAHDYFSGSKRRNKEYCEIGGKESA